MKIVKTVVPFTYLEDAQIKFKHPFIVIGAWNESLNRNTPKSSWKFKNESTKYNAIFQHSVDFLNIDKSLYSKKAEFTIASTSYNNKMWAQIQYYIED